MRNDLTSSNQKAAARRGEKGFSLLELIISMVIFLIVTGAIYGVMSIAQISRTGVNEQVQMTKSVRLALNLVGRDTFNAGYVYPLRNTVNLPDNRISALVGIPNDNGNLPDVVPPVIAGNNVTLNTFNQTPNVRTDQVTFIFKDSTFNLQGAAGRQVSQTLNISAAQTVNGIDQIVPIAGAGGNAACSVNDLYIITGPTGSTLGVVTGLVGNDTIQFANSDSLNFNQSGNSGILTKITTPASIQRLNMVTYFVTTGGILTRRQYANVLPAQAFVDEPLVYGVEDFQIRYIMDNGTSTDNPSAGPDGIPGNGDDDQTNLANVRQIRFMINVRSTELNAADQPFRMTMTSTFSTRNLGYNVS